MNKKLELQKDTIIELVPQESMDKIFGGNSDGEWCNTREQNCDHSQGCAGGPCTYADSMCDGSCGTGV